MIDDLAVKLHHTGKRRLEPAGMHFQGQAVDSDIQWFDMPVRVKGSDHRDNSNRQMVIGLIGCTCSHDFLLSYQDNHIIQTKVLI